MSRPRLRLCLLWLAAAAAGYGARVSLRPEASPGHARPPSANTGAAAFRQPVEGAAKGLHHRYWEPLINARAEDMRGFFEKYNGIPDPSARRAALKGLMARWVQLDPRGALEFFTARNRRDEVAAVLTQWALEDVEAVADELRPPGFPLLHPLEVLQPLASHDAKATLELMEALSKRAPVERWTVSLRLQSVLGRTALVDFEATLKLWRQLPASQFLDKGAVLGEIAGAAALTDPEGALAWARGIEKDSAKAVEEVLRAMARREPRRAAMELMSTPELRNSIKPGTSTGFLVESIAREWGRRNPSEALAWISEVTENRENAQLLARETARDILSGALSDPDNLRAAFHSVQSYLEADKPNFPGYAPPGRIAAVLEILESISSGPERDRLLANLAAQASVENPVDSLKWLEKIMDPKAREAFAERVLIRPGPEAAAQARRMYEALPPDLRGSAAARLAEAQARENAPAAAGWARSLTDGAAGAKAMEAVLTRWTHDNAAEASGWADSLPPGTSRDAAAAGIAAGIVTREPSSAFTWAMSIGDAARRETTLAMTLDFWRGNNREAAVSALNAAPLPADLRERLLQGMNSHQVSQFNP